MSEPGRLFAIGDVHGCADELKRLLDALPLGADDTIVFVGDYIDRGPDSRAVLDLVLEVRARPDVMTICLKGNHEDMCLDYLGRGGHWGDAWSMNGGGATLRSYGIDQRLAGAEVAAHLPRGHLTLLDGLDHSFTADGHLFVHAGIRPDRSLEQQQDEDLLWIRDEFIAAPHALPYTVVFGHTPQRLVLADLPYKIGIDTGCVYGGRLSALEMQERVLYQVSYGSDRVRSCALDAGSVRLRR